MKPLKPCETVAFPKSYAMDIEDGGKGPDSFLIGVVASDIGMHQHFEDIDSMRKWLLRPKKNNGKEGADVWAYNVSYELGHLFGYRSSPQICDEYQINFKYIQSEAALLGCIIKHPKSSTKVKDLSRYMPGGLDKVGKLFKMKKTGCVCDHSIRALSEGKPELREDGTCPWCKMYNVRSHKGMKSMREMSLQHRNAMIEYCEQDCNITLKGAQAEYESFRSFQTRPSGFSIGSKSMRIFRTMFMEPEGFSDREQALNNLEQLSFYGGRTETCDSNLFKEIIYVDVNSMYPAMMTKPMPNPDTAEMVNLPWDEVKVHPGFSLAKVYIPENSRAGMIPVRLSDGICYPVGLVMGVWPHCELLEAEKLGAKIYAYQSVIYEWMSSPFKNFIQQFWTMRKLAIENNDEIGKEQYKLIPNNLFGKFGQRPGGVRELPYDQVCFTLGCKCAKAHPAGDGFEIFNDGENPDWVRFTDRTGKDPQHRRVIFASYITGYGRALVMPYFQHPDVIGGDTDSFFCRKMIEGLDIGKELGQFKLETRFNFQSIAPKQYNFTTWRCYHCPAMQYEPGEHCGQPMIARQFHKVKGINKNFAINLECAACSATYPADTPLDRCSCGGLLGVYGKGERPIKRDEGRVRELAVSSWVQHEKFASGEYTRKVRNADLTLSPHRMQDERIIKTFDHLKGRLKHGPLYVIEDGSMRMYDTEDSEKIYKEVNNVYDDNIITE